MSKNEHGTKQGSDRTTWCGAVRILIKFYSMTSAVIFSFIVGKWLFHFFSYFHQFSRSGAIWPLKLRSIMRRMERLSRNAYRIVVVMDNAIRLRKQNYKLLYNLYLTKSRILSKMKNSFPREKRILESELNHLKEHHR